MSVSLLLLAAFARGQSSIPSEQKVHAIVGARIEIGDGQVIERGTLVIRNGAIVALGTDAALPAGAQVLDGKGLTLMPGFIDAWTDKATSPPEAKPDQDAPPPGSEFASAAMREANRKGVRPELQARSILNLDGISSGYRNAGFTTLMAVPGGGYLPGTASLVNLSGRPARESVLVPQSALAIDFDGDVAGGGYPGSLLGRIAQVRQAFEDARTYRATSAAFAAGGVNRPPSDPTLESLLPALGGGMPSVVEADTPAQIDRALLISAEYNLKPILVGGLQAYKRIDQIKAAHPGIILGLNFGEEPKKPEPTKGDDNADDTPPDSPEMVSERARLYNEAARNAVTLQAAGIRFALSTHGCKDVGEFMTRLRAAVKNGLPRATAVRALTLDSAALLKVDRLVGTLQVGKIANVVAFTGDFLDEKTKVKMMYVDGRRIDPESKPLPPAPGRPAGVVDLP